MQTWTSTCKFFLWLGIVLWLIGAGLVRLDKSMREIRTARLFSGHE